MTESTITIEQLNSGKELGIRILPDGVKTFDTVATIQFQRGPRNVEGSTPGITEAVLYAVLIDRLEGFQALKSPAIPTQFALGALTLNSIFLTASLLTICPLLQFDQRD